MGTEEVSETNGASEISDLESKIIRQIEYYFGDYNLCRDRFLKSQMKENDGWISLSTMITFNRLKQISQDFEIIASALRKSPNDLMEVNEEGTQIRRNPLKPLPDDTEDRKEEVMSRSVYAKGFKVDTSLDELMEFFKNYGTVENILMRKNKMGKKKFKGSIFLTFKTADEAKKFLEENVVSYKGNTLAREPKKDYLARKEVEYLERKKLTEEKQAKKEEESKRKESKDKEAKDKEAGSKQVPAETLNFTRGCLLKMSGFAEDTMREDIKPILEPHGAVSFIDFHKGDPEGVIRFEEPIAAEVLQKVSKDVDGAKRIEIKEANVLAIVLEGEDEEEYYKSVKRKIQEMKSRSRQYQGGGRGGGRGGRHHGSSHGGRHHGSGHGGRHHGSGHGGRQFRKGRGNKRKFDDDEDEVEESSKTAKMSATEDKSSIKKEVIKKEAEDSLPLSPKKIKTEDSVPLSPKKIKTEDSVPLSPKKIKTEDSA